MRTVTMTEFNQRVSAITREVTETGEPVQITNRGTVVLHIAPGPAPVDEMPKARNGRERLEQLRAMGMIVPHGKYEQTWPGKNTRKYTREEVDALIKEMRSERGWDD